MARDLTPPIAVRELGEGPPLVLVHGGFSDGALTWGPVLPELARRYRLLVVDRRGHGASPAEPRPYTIAGDAADVLEAAGRAGAPRFHLAGHSYGGLVALEMACQAPGRVASLHLLEPPYLALLPDDPDVRPLLEEGARLFAEAAARAAQKGPGLQAEAPDSQADTPQGQAEVPRAEGPQGDTEAPPRAADAPYAHADAPQSGPHTPGGGPQGAAESLQSAGEQLAEAFFALLLGSGDAERLRSSPAWPAIVREAARSACEQFAGTYPPEALARLRPAIPVWVYTGGRSHPGLRKIARHLARLIPGARLVELPESGHDLPRRGEACAAALLEALASLS